jgi:hypothetical protein
MTTLHPRRNSTVPNLTGGAWRNRIVGSGEERPDQLLANPANHSDPERVALRALSAR